MVKKIKIAPSILSVDFGKLNQEIAEVEKYSDIVHVDVMDGHFVPNITIGAPVVKWIKTKLFIDVHLMIEHPEKFVKDFVAAGADRIIVHAEACKNLKSVLNVIKKSGVECGVSIKPKTSVSEVASVLSLVDEVLVMTVEPGFGGQKFMPKMVHKISALRKMGFKKDITVDGGINDETGAICVKAGANVLVAGNYIFGAKDRVGMIKKLRAVS
ncbi:ribulose-phosphate 3-epimerase [Candidatus Peregrinibacteria bacterium]|nr:ribulose-phosphate 3-epimerase [Candidatus Peregrinibacteria bacterium]